MALLQIVWQSRQSGQFVQSQRLMTIALLPVSMMLLVQGSGASDQLRLWSSIVLSLVSAVLVIRSMRFVAAQKKLQASERENIS